MLVVGDIVYILKDELNKEGIIVELLQTDIDEITYKVILDDDSIISDLTQDDIGGVDDDRPTLCRWELIEIYDKNNDYETKCGNISTMRKKYCPFCGGRIYVRGE